MGLKTENLIKTFNKKHNFQYRYDKVIFKNTRTKITITCPVHGDFEQWPRGHLKGQNCPKCKGKHNYTTEEFIEKAKQIHGDTYRYHKTNYTNSKEKVTITCQIHGDFEQLPYFHFSGQGCVRCSGVLKHTKEQFIEKAITIHGDRYDYSKTVYLNNREKVIITCKSHGDFEQRAGSHLSGNGCLICKKINLSRLKTITNKEFIEKAITIHGDRYDYSKTNYTNSKEKVTITCQIHGDFKTTPSIFLNSKGCKLCIVLNRKNCLLLYTSKFVEKSNKKHKNIYIYDKTIYTGNKEKVTITCRKHGDFEQTAGNHLTGSGCPVCKMSKGELIIKEILTKNNIEHLRQYRIPGSKPYLPYDFYLPDHNLLIEFQGIQHYFPVERFGGEEEFKKVKERDLFKKSLAELANIRLVEFNYLHLKKLNKEELEKMILNVIQRNKK